MAIWVRTQNKRNLLELNAIWVSENKLRGTTASQITNDDFWPLGDFATKEQAQKELDIIQHWIEQAKPKRVFVIGETMRPTT